MKKSYFVGVDVGTGSCRAALVTASGKVIRQHVKEIQTWSPLPNHYEQSSDNIWSSVCECVQTVSNGFKNEIVGIGFDATCSLVAIDKFDQCLSVSTTGNVQQNIILWMDHRAANEATVINATEHEILQFVGGSVSLEMQCPKLLWLKTHLPDMWQQVGLLFDLPDFLTWKCTGCDSRSMCSVVCKWNYDALNNQWPSDYFKQIGLEDLIENNFHRIGNIIQGPGSPISNGLTIRAANELGLLPNTRVATSMIDAHAGALALFGVSDNNSSKQLENVRSKLAMICGTSACHMSVVDSLIQTPGIWGPYKNALFPGMFLHEAGQSASGILLEYIVKNHPAYQTTLNRAGKRHINEYLHDRLIELAQQNGLKSLHELTRDVHVWPDFHGNRSPLADASLKGMICGLTMTCDEDNLAILYLAFVQAISYGTRHILDTLHSHGRPKFTSILICGGLSKNRLYVQSHANACNLQVLIPKEKEMVLVGAAILGACATGTYTDLESASKGMGGEATTMQPEQNCREYHERKYQVFLKMLADQKSYNSLMSKQVK